jgi:hypothetical protein
MFHAYSRHGANLNNLDADQDLMIETASYKPTVHWFLVYSDTDQKLQSPKCRKPEQRTYMPQDKRSKSRKRVENAENLNKELIILMRKQQKPETGTM